MCSEPSQIPPGKEGKVVPLKEIRKLKKKIKNLNEILVDSLNMTVLIKNQTTKSNLGE